MGGESFVTAIEAETRNRAELTKEQSGAQWILRETAAAYG